MYKNIKTVVVAGSMPNNTPELSKFINVEFQPDEVIIKRISRWDNDEDNADTVVLLNTDLVYPNTIYTYAAESNASLDDASPAITTYYNRQGTNDNVESVFKINGSVNSTYRFWFTRYDNAPVSNLASFDTRIAITLVFIEYKK